MNSTSEFTFFSNFKNYHGTWDTATGFNAPLYPRASETGQDRLFNVDSGVNYWISKGFPKERIVVGVTTYGRSFKLNQPFSGQLGASSSGGGTAGTVTYLLYQNKIKINRITFRIFKTI
jgi:chitinase